MKKTLLLLSLLGFALTDLNSQTQCTFGNYPATYTVSPGYTNGLWFARKYTLSSTATLSGLGLNSLLSPTLVFRMALYTDNSNAPGSLVQSTPQGTMVQGLNVLPVQTQTLIPPGSYWIVAIYGNSGVGVSSQPGASSPYLYQSGNLSTLPANNSGWTSGSNYDMDFYALINAPIVSVSGPTQTCVGSAITLTASGAITYSWNTGATSATISVTPSVNTTYTVGGISIAGCPNYTTFQIVANPLPTLAATSNSVCFGMCNGSVSVTAGSGTGPYTMTLSPVAMVFSTSASAVYNNLCAGVYSAAVSDGKGCISAITTTVSSLSSPTLVVSGNSAVCQGDSTTLSVSGAATYTWNGGSHNASVSITPSISTVYYVTGTGSNGCSSTTNYSVTLNPLPNISLSLSQASICIGDASTLNVTGVSNATLVNNSATGTVFVLSPTVATAYVYTVTGASSLGCTNTATVTQYVINCINGLTETHSQKASVFAQPNPCNGKFILLSSETLNHCKVKVFDLTGRLVQEPTIVDADTAFDLTTQPAGIYILRIDSDAGLKTLKVIKQ